MENLQEKSAGQEIGESPLQLVLALKETILLDQVYPTYLLKQTNCQKSRRCWFKVSLEA